MLSYTVDGKNISDVLRMSVEEAGDFFEEPDILAILARLREAGAAYLMLGQPLSTLSGGELQRIKLAKEMERQGGMYVLDEPSTGLHLSDIRQLMRMLDRLTDQGLYRGGHRASPRPDQPGRLDHRYGTRSGTGGERSYFQGRRKTSLQAKGRLRGGI
ncbi:hypothetical protein VQ056_10470 [Paenibacillus sp. JTLBN-2024]